MTTGSPAGFSTTNPTPGSEPEYTTVTLSPFFSSATALRDQDGGERRIGDDLLGVGVVDVLSVDPPPHPDQTHCQGEPNQPALTAGQFGIP
jgi:hypothetical protein